MSQDLTLSFRHTKKRSHSGTDVYARFLIKGVKNEDLSNVPLSAAVKAASIDHILGFDRYLKRPDGLAKVLRISGPDCPIVGLLKLCSSYWKNFSWNAMLGSWEIKDGPIVESNSFVNP